MVGEEAGWVGLGPARFPVKESFPSRCPVKPAWLLEVPPLGPWERRFPLPPAGTQSPWGLKPSLPLYLPMGKVQTLELRNGVVVERDFKSQARWGGRGRGLSTPWGDVILVQGLGPGGAGRAGLVRGSRRSALDLLMLAAV